MPADLDAKFVAAIRTWDVETAKKLVDVSGISDPNTWIRRYQLITEMLPQDIILCSAGVYSIFELLLSRMDGRSLVNIFRGAVANGQNLLIDMLLALQMFKMKAYDNFGNTALHIAIHKNGFFYLSNLAKQVPNIDAKNKDGSTALHLAAAMDDVNWIVPGLLEAGADCDVQDNLGRTPLHIAAIHGNEDGIEALLEYGADINITCYENRVPIQYRFSDNINTHIISMKAHNQYVSKKNLLHADFNKYNPYTEYYPAQLEYLKTAKINDSDVSFEDLFNCGINQLVVYAGNPKLKRCPNTNRAWYNKYIERRLRLGRKRRRLLEEGWRSLNVVFGKILPDIDISNAINLCLSNKDLENLIEAADICDNDDSNS